jgi:hypothetical protein
MRAKIQAGRALCYATAVAADMGDKAREDLLTPLAKAWSTDLGVEAASLGVQIHGGMGFVEEGGAAQFYRDARIAPIYEGTNGIQAIDLYGRKLLADRGEAMFALIEEAVFMAAYAHIKPLESAANALRGATDFMLSASRDDALTGASSFLQMAGNVAGGLLLAKGVSHHDSHQYHSSLWGDETLFDTQRQLLYFFSDTVLARTPSLLSEVKLGAGALGVFES